MEGRRRAPHGERLERLERLDRLEPWILRRSRGGEVLAYVFWHWRRAEVAIEEYEGRQRAFHSSLAAERVPGFNGSFSVALRGPPWAVSGAETYEDWYLVDDFGALGALNEAAVTSRRAGPHTAAAAAAAGGTAGVYALRLGAPLFAAKHAQWFGKPAGMSYPELLAALVPLVAGRPASLWMRQMVLGSAPEFCLHSEEGVALPATFDVLSLPLRPTWPVEAAVDR